MGECKLTRRGKGETPEPEEPVIVTITGTGNSSYTYVTYNGTKYTSATTFEYDEDVATTFTIKGYRSSSYGNGVYLNGTQVKSGSGTYTYTPTTGTTAIAISLTASSSSGYIVRITETNESLKTYLYNEGDECVSLTGGWGKCGDGYTLSPTKNTDNIYFQSNGTYWAGGITHTNGIDMSGHSKICFEVEYVSGSYWIKCYINTSNEWKDNPSTSGLTHYVWVKTEGGSAPSGRNVYQIDISDISSGTYYACINSYVTNARVYKVWLE